MTADDNTVTLNTTLNITCSAQANPAANYRFYKGQENFINYTTGSDVAVITTQVSERVKQVIYSCIPFNYYGDGPADVITVIVQCKYYVVDVCTDQLFLYCFNFQTVIKQLRVS